MKKRLAYGLGAVFALQAAFTYGVGLAVAPMEQFVQKGKSATYVASNMEEKAIAVEVIIEDWRIEEDGSEVRTPSTDLVAYPRQFILKGNTAKNVKVGRRDRSAPVENERAYRVTIRELPISLEPDEPGTFHVYRASAYRTSYYVMPKYPRPVLEISQASVDEGALRLLVRNHGNAHVHLHGPSLSLTFADGRSTTIEDLEVFKPIAGENMHSQSQRHFVLDLGSHIPAAAQPVQGRLHLRGPDSQETESLGFQITAAS